VKVTDIEYRGADKSLAWLWNETSYSDQDLQHYTKTYNTIPRLTTLYQDLQHYTKAYNTIPRFTTLYQDLQHYTKAYNTIPRLTTLYQDYGVQTTGIYCCCCCLYALSLGVVLFVHSSLFPSRVGLKTYQHPCTINMIPIVFHRIPLENFIFKQAAKQTQKSAASENSNWFRGEIWCKFIHS